MHNLIQKEIFYTIYCPSFLKRTLDSVNPIQINMNWNLKVLKDLKQRNIFFFIGFQIVFFFNVGWKNVIKN